MQIIQLSAFDDNYIYLLEDHGTVAVVDPGDAQVVESELKKRGWGLDLILITHHHPDHIGGCASLKNKYDCSIVGAATDAERIEGIDVPLSQGQSVKVGDASGEVLFTPGHTTGHIVYWFEGEKALFCGDVLFNLGCGRMFEGTPEMNWNSMKAIRSLPADTMCYCAHEYSQANAKFVASVDPDNAAAIRIAADIETKRGEGLPTVPFILADNIEANPFLRADKKDLAALMGLQDPVEVFAKVRKLKDNF